MTAENYHLKWDSHATYLNSSVATLFKNEKYADVFLYSFNSTIATNSGISAHKFILSSCSHYFAGIFENSPLPHNGPIHIVLPPDLSHRAIKILVQYMYVGEATVSNDILNEVLKGGELLKIRGLCRTNNAPATTNLNQTANQNGALASYNLTRMPPLSAGGSSSVRYLVEQPSVLARGLIASVLPKESPVIIKTAKPLSTLAAASSTSAAVMGKLTTVAALGVNKPVALDTSDKKCCFAQETVAPPTSILRDDSSAMCQDVGCNGCPRISKNSQQSILLARERSDVVEKPQVICVKSGPETRNINEYVTQTSGECVEEEDPSLIYEHEMELTTTTMAAEPHAESVLSYSGANSYNYGQHLAARSNQTVLLDGEIQHLVSAPTSSSSIHETPTATSFVAIKEEPTEWLQPPNTTTTNTAQPIPMESFKKIHNIKSEHPPIASTSSSSSSLLSSHHDGTTKENGGQLLSGSRIVNKDFDHFFSCDICKKTCDDKASLLRHLETHSATPCTTGFNASSGDAIALPSTSSSNQTKSYVPKKRRRTSQQENYSDHVCLQCDLCSTRFDTPAEWVRHMSTKHTDVELAIFNSRKDSEKSKSNTPSTSNANKKPGSSTQSQQQQQQQQHLPQRVQALTGSTNSNLNSSTSILCTSTSQELNNDTNETDNLRSTMSPA